MENDKSPGIDKILIELYKTFYDLLETDLDWTLTSKELIPRN